MSFWAQRNVIRKLDEEQAQQERRQSKLKHMYMYGKFVIKRSRKANTNKVNNKDNTIY